MGASLSPVYTYSCLGSTRGELNLYVHTDLDLNSFVLSYYIPVKGE